METIDTNRADAVADVVRRCDEAEIKFVRLWFTDVLGRLKSFAITRDELGNALESGQASSLAHVRGVAAPLAAVAFRLPSVGNQDAGALVVAASGAFPCFDELYSTVVAACIRALPGSRPTQAREPRPGVRCAGRRRPRRSRAR